MFDIFAETYFIVRFLRIHPVQSVVNNITEICGGCGGGGRRGGLARRGGGAGSIPASRGVGEKIVWGVGLGLFWGWFGCCCALVWGRLGDRLGFVLGPLWDRVGIVLE